MSASAKFASLLHDVLMSHRRKNSVRNKVIGKKWIYLERNTLHRQNVGHLEGESGPRV